MKVHYYIFDKLEEIRAKLILPASFLILILNQPLPIYYNHARFCCDFSIVKAWFRRNEKNFVRLALFV